MLLPFVLEEEGTELDEIKSLNVWQVDVRWFLLIVILGTPVV